MCIRDRGRNAPSPQRRHLHIGTHHRTTKYLPDISSEGLCEQAEPLKKLDSLSAPVDAGRARDGQRAGPVALARIWRLFGESFWVVAGQAAVALGALVMIRFLTGLLPPAVFSELTLGTTIATFIQVIFLGPLGASAARYYSIATEQKDLQSFLTSVRRLISYVAVILCIILLFGTIALDFFGSGRWISLVVFTFLFGLFTGTGGVLASIQNSARNRRNYALHSAAETWLRLLLCWSLACWLGPTSANVMLGWTLAALLVMVSHALFLKRSFSHITSTTSPLVWNSELLRYSLPFAAWGCLHWAQSSADRWALHFYDTKENVGAYGVLSQIGSSSMAQLFSIGLQIAGPIVFSRAVTRTNRTQTCSASGLSWRLTALTVVATAILFMIASRFHVEIFQILVADEYHVFSHYFPWLIGTGGIFAASQVLALDILSKLEQVRLLFLRVGNYVFGTLLSVLGAYFFGVAGVVGAGFVSSLSMLVSVAVLSWYLSMTSDKAKA